MSAVDFPTQDMALTHLLVVGDVNRSRDFYENVLRSSLSWNLAAAGNGRWSNRGQAVGHVRASYGRGCGQSRVKDRARELASC